MSIRVLQTSLIAVVLIAILASSGSQADVPPHITYQGRLTGSHGEPETGTYEIDFRIYDADVGGSMVWKENHPSVVVEEGLFTVMLGSIAPFGALFDGSQFWLAIEVDGGGESDPRTPMVMVPYAYRSAVADSAVTAPGDFVEIDGDVMTGDLEFEAGDGGQPEANMNIGSGHVNLEFRDSDSLISKIWGQDYGGAYFYNGSDGDIRVKIDAVHAGGKIQMRDEHENLEIVLDAGDEYNNSVQLPSRSIDEQEILNEPGIARNKDTWFIQVPDTLPVEIVRSTIRAPASGYVVAVGRGYMWMTGERHNSVQISLTTSATEWPYSAFETETGVGREPNRGYDLVRYDSFSLERVWSVDSAESLTCYMLARQYEVLSDYAAIHNPSVLLMYFPTSYGSVSTWVSADEAEQFDRVAAAPMGDSPIGKTSSEALYKVDLRELEIRALKKRLEAQQAERDYEEARKQQGQNRQ